ncbi:MAG: GDSL-type esterase/lipase family protein, partial [Chloroflexota bacterium]|nr:GDSL-type esterase/lipase family protein [Chloroflexota bacterium]
ILDALLERLPPDRIVAVATPDYTVTPQGADYGDPRAQAAGIRAVNEILRGLAADRGIAWVDIHDLSLRAAADRSLVADDGLHPSGTQYGLWVERIAPVVTNLLGR